MLHQPVNANYLQNHVSALADTIGERNLIHVDALNKAADYINDQWSNMGYNVRTQKFKTRGVKCFNLEVTHLGSWQPNNIILIGAHYDSCHGSPGANGNGSGIAAQLEIARVIKQMDTQYSYRFVAFSNEEPPYFGTDSMGSWVYARHARQRGDNIRAAIILNSIGYYTDAPASQLAPPMLSLLYPRKGNFVNMLSNLRSFGVTRQFTKLFKQNSNMPARQISVPEILPGVHHSDECPFWLNGYKAFTVTDTAKLRYPFYHTHRDTSDRLDYKYLTQVTSGLVKAARHCEGVL